jgi:pseudaminic acid cytidylyltransferase
MDTTYNALAIIPARGGSKRIPRKNIRPFLGKPIIGYVIETTLQSGLFADVMVSTDDDEIAAIAESFGARVPFRRKPETANDTATTAAVLQEVLTGYQQLGREFGVSCCLYPTAPFVTADLLKQAFEKLKTGNFDTVMPVQRFGFPIQRALRVDSTNNRLAWFQPEHALTRSQDLEPAYHDAGQFYLFDVARFQQSGRLLTENTAGIVISEMLAQDIDNEDDWRLAELKYRLGYP